VIQITLEVFSAIVSHAMLDLPNEACGYLSGKDGIITNSYALTNVDHSPEHFSFAPAEQFSTVKKARKEGMEILANYHSHPGTPARPSEEDIRLAFDPDIFYFIISLAASEPDVKAFRIVNGFVKKVEIQIKK
jgi:[CysO sulfur-carrier protein]-S-L-cysteine hydrolase